MKKKKLRILSNITDVYRTYLPGDVCEVDEAVAEHWLEIGIAEAVANATHVTVPETATAVGAPEHAVEPKAKPR